MFQQALQFFTSIPAAFSTGKKRKRMAEEQAATEDRATANKLRTVSAPQQRVSSREDGADPHAGPPAPPVTHTQHTATTPGLHSTLQTLKLSHDIKPVSNGQALMPPPSSSQQQHHQRPSLAGLERLQPSLPSNTNTLLHSTQPRHHTAVHAPMQTHQPVVAKRLHADFNKAEHAQQQAAPPQQQTGLMPPPSSRITSAHSSFTRPHQPLYSSRTVCVCDCLIGLCVRVFACVAALLACVRVHTVHGTLNRLSHLHMHVKEQRRLHRCTGVSGRHTSRTRARTHSH